MFHRCLGCVLVLALTAAIAASARADQASDQVAIRERLQRWTTAFNTRDATGTCDIFASDLAYSIPGVPLGSRQSICADLSTAFGNSVIQLRYDNPNIHEIIVSGDFAVVRLTWTLTVQKGAERDVTTEEGMDLFRRQPDGRWSIARFMSFATQPNKLLQ